MTDLEKLKEWIKESDNIVFFGGAGVSTESGIPDFRSSRGIFNQKYSYQPEEIVSHDFFFNHTAEFYDFYKEKMVFPDAQPNTTHKVLAQLEEIGKLKAVITQNIDGLHQKAGSKNVIELHGSVLRNYCLDCGKNFDEQYIINSDGIPKCDKCGGLIKPDVVLYQEGLNNGDLTRAVSYINKADILIIGGTSLVVYPAAGLINYYYGNKLCLINKDSTPYDNNADLVIHDSLGKVFKEIEEIL